MAGWLCPQLGGRLPAINHVPHDAFFDQGHSLARHSLSVESRARLQRVIDVIENTDVLAEDLLAETPSQETPLIAQRGGAEISKQLSRSEERRVGKECRSRWSTCDQRKKEYGRR